LKARLDIASLEEFENNSSGNESSKTKKGRILSDLPWFFEPFFNQKA